MGVLNYNQPEFPDDPYPSVNGNYYQNASGPGLFTDIRMGNDYRINPGVIALPITGPVPTDPVELQDFSPVRIVQVHAPYRERIVAWSNEKDGSPPASPLPDDTGVFVFLGGSLKIPVPSVSNSLNAFKWHTEGIYAFVENCVARNEDGFVLGDFPLPLQIQVLSATPSNPPLGAVSYCGIGPQTGWLQGQSITSDGSSWTYTEPSFYPSQLFDASILNGGPDAY
jgi:hypothetical protein